ncbi:hypothetical protein NDK47_24795 [Brevibacillus ruminantium]|uniref:Uncharacterized protein n=1 Tax=Brevibacillus ruminantium TaxID=2950604 RepID=A0ABY4WDZ0_9BACL|nr:hypothetical protein [Brevibacillus ruminantium]USG65287.1 hypothetical protein NDK47_24795 [Brevibacillus ruminantium]
MKKILSLALATCVVFAGTSVFAETDHSKKHKTHHKMHTKSMKHKVHTKAAKGHKLHIKAAPGMPKTGMGGASESN